MDKKIALSFTAGYVCGAVGVGFAGYELIQKWKAAQDRTDEIIEIGHKRDELYRKMLKLYVAAAPADVNKKIIEDTEFDYLVHTATMPEWYLNLLNEDEDGGSQK